MHAEMLRPGDGVRVAGEPSDRFYGRLGVLVEMAGEEAVIRFSAVRTYTVPRKNLRRLIRGVR